MQLSNKTLSKTLGVIALAASLLGTNAHAGPIINDGGTHDITTAIGGGAVGLNISGAGTVVNLLHPGSVSTTGSGGGIVRKGIRVGGGSTLNLIGGNVSVNASGGSADAYGIDALAGSTVALAGGTFGGNVTTTSNGGAALSIGLRANNAVVDILGGLLILDTFSSGGSADAYGLQLRGASTGQIFGGDIIANASGGGAKSRDLRILDTSILTIYGSSFNLGYGSIGASSGNIIGTLSDGTDVNFSFSRAAGAQIILANVPEPTTLLLLATGLIGMRLGRRKILS